MIPSIIAEAATIESPFSEPTPVLELSVEGPSDNGFDSRVLPGENHFNQEVRSEIPPFDSLTPSVRYFVDGAKLEEVGKGSMGDLREVYDNHLGRMCVLKTVKGALFDDSRRLTSLEKDFRANLLKEVRLTAHLSHPNIVEVHELVYIPRFDTDKYPAPALIMEKVDGVCFGETSLSGEALLNVADKIADALDYMHEEGVVHRDINPANIMVRPNGDPVIIDFGIASGSYREEDIQLVEYGENSIRGARRGKEHIDATGKYDQYSLAWILFEKYYGKAPTFEFHRRIGSHKNINVLKYEDHMNPRVWNVFSAALAQKPENRYSCCTDFAQRLRAAYKKEMSET